VNAAGGDGCPCCRCRCCCCCCCCCCCRAWVSEVRFGESRSQQDGIECVPPKTRLGVKLLPLTRLLIDGSQTPSDASIDASAVNTSTDASLTGRHKPLLGDVGTGAVKCNNHSPKRPRKASEGPATSQQRQERRREARIAKDAATPPPPDARRAEEDLG
jgi:hypothetical protein